MLDCIYASSTDREVVSYILYANKTGKLFVDAGCETQATADEVSIAFNRARLVVSYDGGMYAPVSFAKNSVTILTVTGDKAAATLTPISLAVAKSA